ncbi:MAG: excinuclease ABC subunit UvrC [Verrucomicrobia bacterium]|nr:excinuclease ABC subunit UvrC [Verrucomicrobiota bacterium]
MAFDPKTLALYPDQPGVYLMKDAGGKVLYIGKAKNLKSRIKQYFSQTDQREMIPYLISQVEEVATIVALTEKDALILENNLIKQHKPKYNVLLKDDKTFISLVITKHKWPMLQLVRYKGKPKDNGIYFGPYTSAWAARQIYELMIRLFPLRQCSDSELASRKRPCLLYDIKKCIAPCVGKCTEEQYHGHVQSAIRLLKGQNKEIVKHLKKEMEKASEALEFERAEEILSTIRQLEHVTETQHIQGVGDCDVLALHREGSAVLVAQLLFREGTLVASEHFSFHLIVSDDAETLESFLFQHYKNNTHLPEEILIPFELSQQEALEEILSETAQRRVAIRTPQKGKKKDLVEMAQKNATAQFAREQDQRSLKEKMLLDLQETLKLTRFPRRIECFDTSNISGTDPVASLVSYELGEKDNSRSRLFKIKDRERADDYTAMKQVIHRHFVKAKEKNDFCDLLIVDGGKGQMNLALEIFQELGIASVDVIGVSKDEARHDKGLTQEKIYVPHTKEPLLLDPRSPLLFLLQKIRDEAHRRAIEFHRKRRSKRTLSSGLDELPGIGPTKKRRLLQKFGSVKAIKNATREELSEVEGINKNDLDTLMEWITL